jgi:general nucleoside transport system ATP-binding protein
VIAPNAELIGMYRLELVDVTKRYPGVTANDRVSLAVRPGEIHAIVGENGAGKSTLMKIVYGMVRPDSGELRWNGQPLAAQSPREARGLGIAMVFQHFSLFESMTAAQNVWLGLDRKSFHARAPHAARASLDQVSAELRRVGSEYGLPLDPGRPVHDLSVGERQRVEILRALLSNPHLLILDEPTSVLTPQAVKGLFATLRKLAAEGRSILYISHKLDEIRALCDTATIVRAGRVVGKVNPANETTASLARLMLGGDPPRIERRPGMPRQVSLSVEGLSLEASEPFGIALRDIHFVVRAGEILGIAGVSGNGQRELLAALSGEEAARVRGRVRLHGEDITRCGPRLRREKGLRFAPEERLGRASVPSHSLAKNALLTHREMVRTGLVQLNRLRSFTEHLLRTYDVKAAGPESSALSLSGGNLQKFIVGRELDAAPSVLIVSQPTWGVDVGASARIRSQLLAARDAGSALLVVSEELDELFEICDALVVIAGGRLSPRLEAGEVNAERIGEWMSGLWPHADGATVEGNHVAAF